MSSIERPNTSDYFSFYGIEQTFDIDKTKLKTLFLEKSRLFHPDFFMDNPESQTIALAVSAFNNLAYKILGNEISRAQYLVALNKESEEEKPTLSNDFLMEMLDINEAIDELLATKEEAKSRQLSLDIVTLKEEILSEIIRQASKANWQDTQIAILKWKYLERLETRIRDLG